MFDNNKFGRIITGNLNPQKCCFVGKPKRDRFRRKYIPIKIPNENGSQFLFLKHYEYPYQSTIQNSIRTWYLGRMSAVADLSYQSFVNALELLAKRLNLPIEEILLMEILRLEIGASIELEAKHSGIIQSFINHPRLKRDRYNIGTAYFMGKHYHIIFYDKLMELKDHGHISKKVYDKLSKHVFILRIEKVIKSKSGVKIMDGIKTIEHLLDNWNKLLEDLANCFFSTDYIDLFSTKKDIELNSLTSKQLKEYYIYLGVRQNGIEKVIDVGKKYLKNRKSETIQELINIYNRNTSGDKRTFFTEVSNNVVQKIGSLKQKDMNYFV